MTIALIVAGVLLALVGFKLVGTPRFRLRPGRDNNWKNQAFEAREKAGSWSENEAAVGYEDAAPPSYIPWGGE